MKIVIAVDSFKGSLSSREAAEAIGGALCSLDPTLEIRPFLLADGGEGTVETILSATNGKPTSVTVEGPLGAPVSASYGVIPESGTAVMEMAAAAGITLVAPEARNPMLTSTYGVGEMIADAIRGGCRSFVIGIGGSATNDGGTGMLSALGFEFLDAEGKPIARGAGGLRDLREIRTDRVMPELAECRFCVACDVTNPLCGERGCSHVFAPQKGGTPEMILEMDSLLGKYADLARAKFPDCAPNYPGSGAAGGLGFAFRTFLGAELKSGIELILDAIGVEREIADADLVITGEGRIDGQSYMGKAPIGIAKLAKRYGKPVVAFCGCVSEDAAVCNGHGIDAIFPILRTPCTVTEAMECKNASANLSACAKQVFGLIRALRPSA